MQKLDHFAFEVSDMDKAVHFYHDLLGLDLVSRGVHEDVGEEYAFLDLGHATLELLKLMDHDFQGPESRPSNCPHLAFRTDEMDDILKLIQDNDIRIVKGPLIIEGHERWIYIADPDGNVVEFIQWL